MYTPKSQILEHEKYESGTSFAKKQGSAQRLMGTYQNYDLKEIPLATFSFKEECYIVKIQRITELQISPFFFLQHKCNNWSEQEYKWILQKTVGE